MFKHRNKGFSSLLIILIVSWFIVFIGVTMLWKYPGFSSKDKDIVPQDNIRQDRILPEKEKSVNNTDNNRSADNSTPAQSYLITKSFSYPYPVSATWTSERRTAEMSLTKVSLGERTVPDFVLAYNSEYKANQEIYALTLYLKIKTYWEDVGVCLPTDYRLLINEEGDLQAPINSVFTIGCPKGNRTYFDQEIIFVVPESQREFILTTGGKSNIFFTVTILNNTEIKVEKIATSETGSCSAVSDMICPASCTIGSDADCCKNAEKYWLKTFAWYGCYDSNYNPGCVAGKACSQTSDNCCPNWCAVNSDADCCVQIKGNYWVLGKGCFSSP